MFVCDHIENIHYGHSNLKNSPFSLSVLKGESVVTVVTAKSGIKSVVISKIMR